MENDFEEEPPDELCDPIMGTLMENPVKLPTSGQIVDRTTIARQLLSAPMDPFNRQPLTLDQVIPLPDMKEPLINHLLGKWSVISRLFWIEFKVDGHLFFRHFFTLHLKLKP